MYFTKEIQPFTSECFSTAHRGPILKIKMSLLSRSLLLSQICLEFYYKSGIIKTPLADISIQKQCHSSQ